jgi:hypothetical protein
MLLSQISGPLASGGMDKDRRTGSTRRNAFLVNGALAAGGGATAGICRTRWQRRAAE